MKIYILVTKFLFIGALFIVSNHNLRLSVSEERKLFFELYYEWFNNVYSQMKSITGYVIESQWLPKINETIKQNTKTNNESNTSFNLNKEEISFKSQR